MGLSKPKPDFTVGLRRSAFRNEEFEKLENYGTPQNPFYFTPDLSLPFLIFEAKTGRTGIDLADTQNIHSASIVTKAIVSMYVTSFGREHEEPNDLLGRVLVFTVSHKKRMVNLYGHYAVAGMNSSDDTGDQLVGLFQYFRYDIAMFSLSTYDGRGRFRAYNFVENLYDRFAPQHLERIREAIGSVQRPVTRTGLSFAVSDIGFNTGNLPWFRGLMLLSAQLLGAITAAGSVQVIIPGNINTTQTTLANAVSPAQGLFLEITADSTVQLLTAYLIFTILMLAAEKQKSTFVAPIGIGLAFCVAEIAGVFYTGASLNPARSFAPCVLGALFPHYHLIYRIGPILGALDSGGYYHFVKFSN
ncbi:Aquaporin-1 [Oleoguttula sp. CCFEE 5521]